MRCLTTKSTRNFAVLFPLLLVGPKSCDQEQIDSFCTLYTKVVIEAKDAEIKGTSGMKRRLLANELLYKAQCPPAKT